MYDKYDTISKFNKKDITWQQEDQDQEADQKMEHLQDQERNQKAVQNSYIYLSQHSVVGSCM